MSELGVLVGDRTKVTEEAFKMPWIKIHHLDSEDSYKPSFIKEHHLSLWELFTEHKNEHVCSSCCWIPKGAIWQSSPLRILSCSAYSYCCKRQKNFVGYKEPSSTRTLNKRYLTIGNREITSGANQLLTS